MPKFVNDSQFYMWRTIFALAHADAVVKREELLFMAETMEDLPFSEEQLNALRDDVIHPKCVDEMYEKVTDILDQATFFEFARELVHIDGAFVTEEQAVMLRVNQHHLRNVDVDQLVGQIRLDLADEDECHEFKPTVYFCRREFLKRLVEEKPVSTIVTDSQFYMWRAIFALAHADDVVSPEELRFMSEALEDIPFSEEQKAVLKSDTTEEQSVEAMFKKITDPVDQAEFFKFASKLAHIDGDFGKEEQEIILRVKQLHLANVDIDELVGKVEMKFDEDNIADEAPDFKSTVHSYRQKFLEKLMGNQG